jgi:aspartyl protease family protein
MWYLFWVLLLGLLALFFSRWEQQRYHPNAELVVREGSARPTLVLKPNRQGHYLLDGRINGTEALFLIDTGASDVVIPSDLATEAGLVGRGRFFARTANGTIEVSRTVIDRLELGPLVLRDVSATINPHMQGEVLLGMSALKHLELGQNAEGMTLRPGH